MFCLDSQVTYITYTDYHRLSSLITVLLGTVFSPHTLGDILMADNYLLRILLTILKVLVNAKEAEDFVVSLSLGSDRGLKRTTIWLSAVFIARNSYELFKCKKLKQSRYRPGLAQRFPES